MKKIVLCVLVAVTCSLSLHAQLALAKVVGKNADNYKLGYGLFSYYDIPLNDIGNQSARIEILDVAYFPSKTQEVPSKGYVSIKLGYKNIFSETKTGFYLEPQVGYCRVADGDGNYGDGVAAAAEVGYSLEVGQNGHTFNFGVKYETDRAGKENTMSSVDFRFSFSFNLFRQRED